MVVGLRFGSNGLRFGSDGLRFWLILCVLWFRSVIDRGLDQWVLGDIKSFLVCCDTWGWLVVDRGFGGLLWIMLCLAVLWWWFGWFGMGFWGGSRYFSIWMWWMVVGLGVLLGLWWWVLVVCCVCAGGGYQCCCGSSCWWLLLWQWWICRCCGWCCWWWWEGGDNILF